MPAGRPRKPTKTKKLQGTFRKDRSVPREPEPPPLKGDPSPPKFLRAHGREMWKRLATRLSEMQVLTEADLSALEATCMAYQRWRQAAEAVDTGGPTYEAETGAGALIFRTRPEVHVESDSWRRFMAGLIQFGLTPSARSKVSAVAPPGRDGSTGGGEDRLAALFRLPA